MLSIQTIASAFPVPGVLLTVAMLAPAVTAQVGVGSPSVGYEALVARGEATTSMSGRRASGFESVPARPFSIGTLDGLFSRRWQDPESAPQDPPVQNPLGQDPPVQDPGVQDPPVQDPPVQGPPVQDQEGGELMGPGLPPIDKGNFSYDYAEARFKFGDYTGLILEGSYGFHESWFGIGQFEWAKDDISGVDVTILSFAVGGGYHHPILPELDLVGTAELEFGRGEGSAGGQTASDTEFGVRIRAGARYQLLPEVELRGGMGYRSFFDGAFQVDVAGQYNFTPEFGGILQFEVGEHTLVSLGGRYDF